MKNIFIAAVLMITLSNCNTSPGNDEKANENGSGLKGASDTIHQPSGVINSSPISTDTAAINVQNSIKKADSLDSGSKR
jgi:hypothetical protein